MTKVSITKDHIDQLMAASTWTDCKVGAKTTVVCATLPNGFEVVETSACIDPANYDHAVGVAVCRRRIEDKFWLLEGYRLQCEQAGCTKPLPMDQAPRDGSDVLLLTADGRLHIWQWFEPIRRWCGSCDDEEPDEFFLGWLPLPKVSVS